MVLNQTGFAKQTKHVFWRRANEGGNWYQNAPNVHLWKLFFVSHCFKTSRFFKTDKSRFFYLQSIQSLLNRHIVKLFLWKTLKPTIFQNRQMFKTTKRDVFLCLSVFWNTNCLFRLNVCLIQLIQNIDKDNHWSKGIIAQVSLPLLFALAHIHTACKASPVSSLKGTSPTTN